MIWRFDKSDRGRRVQLFIDSGDHKAAARRLETD